MDRMKLEIGAPEAATVSKATLRAAERLRISSRILAAIIGVSEPSISRMRKGEFTLVPGEKPFELGVLFVRLYGSLNALVSGDERAARAWLHAENTALGGIPMELIQNITGLVNAIQYLDARRAVVCH
jgi:Protein of unknown function (DUF2384)